MVTAAFLIAAAIDGVVLIHRVRHGVGSRQALIPFYLSLGALVVVLLLICWKTGERPRWRCGN
jgi:hypothetical protein